MSNSRIPDALLLAADELGIRLEIQGDLPLWEPSPRPLHQRVQFEIMTSIAPRAGEAAGCACIAYHDISIRFPDGSIKRPDISLFCGPIDERELTISRIPDAVVEILSPGSELKDLELSPPFYLMHGVKDVIVFDPETKVVLHRQVTATTRHQSPVTIDLACGCRVAV